MNPFRPLVNVFSRMSPRERTLVGGAMLALVATCLYSFVLDPLTVGRAQLARDVVNREKDLRSVVALRTRYLDVKQKLTAGQNLLAAADPNFSLFTFLETTISQVIPRERIASMNPNTKTIGEEYEEELVEIKLAEVSLEQLVDMLYRIEKGNHPLRVTRLQVKKRKNDIHTFDITATVSLVGKAT